VASHSPETKINLMRRGISKIFAFIAALSMFATVVPNAHAGNTGSLFFSPSAGSLNPGATFSIWVMAASPDEPANAVQAAVKFPADLLEITSTSKIGSILSLWVQEPAYSNANGSLSFEGVAFNPGYQGNAARLLSITFKAKAAGTANITFSSASLLANDGNGTNILGSMGAAKYTVNGATPPSEKPVPAPAPVVVKPPVSAPVQTIPPPPPTPKPKSKLDSSVPTSAPNAPTISSGTHPNQDIWYADPSPTLTWSVSNEIDAVSYLLDHEPNTDPTEKANIVRSQWKYEKIADGVWYFHIRMHNLVGWGETAHYRIQIDRTPPEVFSLDQQIPLDPNDPTRIVVTGSDSVSGIEKYHFTSENRIDTDWVDSGDHLFVLPDLPTGIYRIDGIAKDRAGNTSKSSVFVTVTSASAEGKYAEHVLLDVPPITQLGQPLVVNGSTEPNAVARIKVQFKGGSLLSIRTRADGEGNFSVNLGVPEVGETTVWSEGVAVDGSIYPLTPKYLSHVLGYKETVWDIQWYWWFLIFFLIILIILSSWYWFVLGRREKEDKEDKNQGRALVKRSKQTKKR